MSYDAGTNLWRLPNGRRKFPIDSLPLYVPLGYPELSGSPFLSKDLNAHSCTVTGATHVPPVSRTFDGDDFIDTGNSFQSTFQSSFSFGGWVKPDDGHPGIGKVLIGTNDEGPEMQASFQLLATGAVTFVYEESDNIVRAETDDPVFTDGAQGFHQVFAVGDSTIGGVGGLKVYFDGVVKALDATNNGNTSAATFANYVNAFNVYLGALNNDGSASGFWNGSMGEFWIYSKALSAAEILHIYNRTLRRYV